MLSANFVRLRGACFRLPVAQACGIFFHGETASLGLARCILPTPDDNLGRCLLLLLQPGWLHVQKGSGSMVREVQGGRGLAGSQAIFTTGFSFLRVPTTALWGTSGPI